MYNRGYIWYIGQNSISPTILLIDIERQIRIYSHIYDEHSVNSVGKSTAKSYKISDIFNIFINKAVPQKGIQNYWHIYDK